jgi:hypothetical protein
VAARAATNGSVTSETSPLPNGRRERTAGELHLRNRPDHARTRQDFLGNVFLVVILTLNHGQVARRFFRNFRPSNTLSIEHRTFAPRTRIGLCAGFGSPGSTTSGSVIGGSGISPGFSIGGDVGSGTGISGCGGSGGISTGGMPGPGAGGRGTWSAWSASNFSKTNTYTCRLRCRLRMMMKQTLACPPGSGNNRHGGCR